MDVAAKFDTWKATVLGMGLDIDKAYGKQCVDVDLSWGQALYPGVHYSVLFPPVLSAKDMFDRANPAYWEKIPNDHNNVNQLPIKGDIAVFAAVSRGGDPGYTSKYENPDGHTAVVDHADAYGPWLVQQDGSTNQTITQLRQRAWRYSRCIGWLRPKQPAAISNAATVSGPTTDSRIGRNVWLKPVAQRSVYRRGQFPDRAKRIGYLIPKNYNNGPNGQPGLTYTIQGVSQHANTVSIVSDAYGPVDIYLDGDAQIL